MSSPDLARVRRLVERVHDLSAEERSRVLAAECAGDSALRSEVETLLRAAASTPGFLERSPALPSIGSLLPASAAGLAPGTRLGAFRLVRRLASGGMGTVWEAEQDAPRRRVAVKVLRDGTLGQDTLRRFLREPELLGRLRHPCIAQVLAAGVEELAGGESLPWYALELVEEARTLTRHASERGLDLRARLELVERLCAAVQHGHERGVIHRDLKPSNVLVDGSGALKVIDFGIARALDPALTETFATEPGRVIGTLQYMSPEQIEGSSDGADTRSDVFALGVMLYELTVGEPPHDLRQASLVEAARTLLQDPPRPGARTPGYPEDLEAISLRALERDRERRYSSAGELGADIGRFLRGEPVAARAPSMARQLARLARRHRAWATAGFAIAVVSLAAGAISMRQAWRAQRAESAALARLADVRGLARSVLFDLHDAVEHLPGATNARREIAAVALTYLDELEAQGAADEGLLSELAEGRLRLGQALGAPGTASLGDRAGARRELVRSIDASRRWLMLAPHSVEARLTLSRAHFAHSCLVREDGDLAAAREMLETCEAEMQDIARDGAWARDAERMLETVRLQRAKVLALEGRATQAQELLEELSRSLRSRREQGADDPELWGGSTLVELELGIQHVLHGRPTTALPHLEQALRLTSERRARWPEDAQNEREELMALGWYSVAQLDLGETRRARDGLEEIVARARGLIESDPGDRTAHQALGFLLQRLGRARLADGDPQGSLRAHDEALRLFSEDVKRTGGEREALLSQAEALLEVGEAHRASARPEDSLEAYRQACSVLLELETRQPQAIDVARKLAGALARLGDAALNAGDGAAAAGHYAQAQQRIERAAAADPAHAWTQRMVMVIRGWRGVAHRAAAQRAAAAERTTHLDAAIQALESALMLEPDLNAAGFLRPNDEAAIEKLIADLEDCRFERTGAREP